MLLDTPVTKKELQFANILDRVVGIAFPNLQSLFIFADFSELI
jgi:hypothetical protein